jgi:hypothetical protein
MKNQNGIEELSPKDELPQLPNGLKNHTYDQLYSPYGYKIVEVNGSAMWQCGTREEYVRAEALRLGIPESQVEEQRDCVQTGPQSCSGGCLGPGGTNDRRFCLLYYDPQQHYYYCSCPGGG